MKKPLLALFISVISVTACKKDKESRLVLDVKTPVQFTFSDFVLSEGALGKSSYSFLSSSDALNEYVDFLYYRVYNGAGALVKAKVQGAADAQFGVISDSLSHGNYTVVFSASKKKLTFSEDDILNASCSVSDGSCWDEVFIQKLNLEVGASPIVQNFRLNRVVAGLQLNIQPDLPSNIASITIATESEHSTYKLHTGGTTGMVRREREWILYSNQPLPKYLLMHVLNFDNSHRVVITAYDRTGSVAIRKTIENVMFYPNKKTVFTGSLSVDTNLGIELSPAWGDPAESIKF